MDKPEAQPDKVKGQLTEYELVAEDYGGETPMVPVSAHTKEGLDDLPVVSGVDIGHTDPMWTVPQGVRLRVDPAEQRLTFLEAGVV